MFTSNFNLKSKISTLFVPLFAPYRKYSFGVSSTVNSWRTDPKRLVIPLQYKKKELTETAHNGYNGNGHHSSDPELMSSLLDLRRPYRILCLDGGGIRGCLTIALLRRIIEHNPSFLNEVDFICGTSAGGILSLLIASGYTATQCQDIFVFAAPHIFKPDLFRRLNPFRAKFCDKAKEEIFKEYFGDRTMNDLHKTAAAVAFRVDGFKSTTHSFFNKEGWRPAVFSNMPRAAGM
eukprot:gene1454-2797_t